MMRGQKLSGGGPIVSFHRDNNRTQDPFSQLLITTQEIRSLDSQSQATGITGEILMESAAQGVYRWFLNELMCSISTSSNTSFHQILEEKKQQTQIIILCGSGNNGGDGLALGRICTLEGWKTRIFLCDYKTKGLAPFQKQILDSLGITTYPFQTSSAEDLIPNSFCIFDCILGTGQRLPLGEHLIEPVNFLTSVSNRKGIKGTTQPFIVALDVPTGFYKADYTLCLGAWNLELYVPEFRRYCGTLNRIPLPFVPFSDNHEHSDPIGTFIDYYKTLNSFGNPDAHSYKNQRGSIGVIGGSSSYPGAPILTLEAAAKSGAGLLYYETGFLNQGKFEHDILSENDSFSHNPRNSDRYNIPTSSYIPLQSAKSLSSLVIGPGWNTIFSTLETTKTTESNNRLEISVHEQLLLRIFSKLEPIYNGDDQLMFSTPFVILDAGALRILARSTQLQRILSIKRTSATFEVILTPHYGELKELLTGFFLEIEPQSSEICKIQALAKGLRSWIIVKFDSTILVDPNGRLKILDHPCSILGFGGSGDILAGIIATQLAKVQQTLDSLELNEVQEFHGATYYASIWEALEKAVVLHNYVGKICEEELGFVTPQEYLIQLGKIQVHNLGDITS